MSDQQDAKVIKQLLQRPYPEGYVEEWTELLKNERRDLTDEALSPVFIFRVSNEWLALPVRVVKEIFTMKVLHTIPHKMNDILKGTVNVGGLLKLYVSLANLLEIASDQEEEEGEKESQAGSGYMCLISLADNDWVIKIDAILGIRKVGISSLENTPVTVLKSTANFLKGIFRLEEKDVAYIDEELLFFTLKRRSCE